MQTVRTLSDLAQIKAGQKFLFGGMVHLAYEDAVDGQNRFTQERVVSVRAGRAHGGMPSGFECCDLREYDTTMKAMEAYA